MPIALKIALLALSLAFLYYTLLPIISLAPWIPTRKKDLERIGRMASLKDGEVFYDLGSGDGRLVLYMAGKHPGSSAIGLELFWPAALFSWIKHKLDGPKNAKIRLANALKADLRNGDAIFLFAMPESLTKKLMAKLKAELKPGSRIIPSSFHFPDWTPAAIDKPTKKDLAIYLYII
jgi:cyclopropane fatty-acyl-phospholipid synthase-like methyltransferase